jgi:uncharacterized protein with PQ loop repeat
MLVGMISTTLFVVSYLPMLVKAVRTKDLTSYSLGNLVLANVGNAVHSVYVYSLPIGPIWFLHTFYLASTAAMLVWHRRYARRPRVAPQHVPAAGGGADPGAEEAPGQVTAGELDSSDADRSAATGARGRVTRR